MGSASTFISSRFLLFFFFPAFVDFGRQFLLLWTVYTLFTHCAYTVHTLKNIKNESHDTIYTFKYYFVTVFSIFSNNKFNPNTPNKSKNPFSTYLNIYFQFLNNITPILIYFFTHLYFKKNWEQMYLKNWKQLFNPTY